MNAFFVVFVVLVAKRADAAACTNNRPAKPPQYHLTKECAESKMRTIASSNATAFSWCVKLAEAKNAFAFTYANRTDQDSSDVPKVICNVYECPESHGFLLQTTAAENNNASSAYDYYSMYSKPLPTENFTCAPGIGMFELVVADVLNYSNAMMACEQAGGHLANVFSDSRTSFLATLVSASLINRTAAFRRAFVGLFYENNDFVSITGEPLSCMPYRAWAPAHPKASHLKHDCVVVTANRYWQTVECSMKLPYICELIPDGPLSPVERYCAPIKRRNNCILRHYKQYKQVDQRKQKCIYNNA